MAKKVFIGVGHGGKDPGAVANGFKEKDLNLAIALACKDELVRHGVSVQMSRYKDEDDNTAATECNAYNPDLAVDIHNNAGGGDGAEVFHTINGGTGKTLAQNILNEIVAIGQNSRGLKTKKNSRGTDYFGFIRSTKAPAVIVECAFVDNKKDIAIIDTATEQKAMGVAIAKGILTTLGISKKETTATPTATVKKPTATATAKKSADEIAKEVIAGKWGNGTDRKNRLVAAGYNYSEVQAKVNALCGKSTTTSKKSNEEIAREVIQGKWGNGETRKKKLTAAGYNYSDIQKIVNKLL